ncbi:MAG: hypothetical protein KKH01_01210 [Firmicutes bacterium]|nr:hypothetical protein [Bacillota bacterium]
MNKATTLYQLGLDYYHGNEFAQDTDMAIDYLLKAAELNHFEAKVLCADLLFKQAKDDGSIYFEDGYRLGTELMVQIYRAGKLDITLAYLLNNELFDALLTEEELQDYYQEAYRLGYRETKFELAKLLFKKESYHSSEQWFLESIKEDISKESHLYLYQIYCTKECYNEKKAITHLKEAMKYGFTPSDYQEFIETDDKVLVQNQIYHSKFDEDMVKNQIVSIIKHCNYADKTLKKWLTKDKLDVHIYFDLQLKLLNASYDIIHFESDSVDFAYAPIELIDRYFEEEIEKADVVNQTVISPNKDSGFFQTIERETFLELNIRDVLDQFNIKDKKPILNTTNANLNIDQMIRSEIKKDIKLKHKDKSKQQFIKVKKFTLYKVLVPTFSFDFKFSGKTYQSERYAFDSKEWHEVFFNEDEDIDDKAVKLKIEFPLSDAIYQEIEIIKKEVPKYRKRMIYIHIVKSILMALLLWSVIIFVQNSLLSRDYHIESYQFFSHLVKSYLMYIGGIIFFGLIYYFTRVMIYAPILDNIRDQIVDDPAFVLPENTNKDHFKMQYLEIVLMFVTIVILILFSNFISIF